MHNKSFIKLNTAFHLWTYTCSTFHQNSLEPLHVFWHFCFFNRPIKQLMTTGILLMGSLHFSILQILKTHSIAHLGKNKIWDLYGKFTVWSMFYICRWCVVHNTVISHHVITSLHCISRGLCQLQMAVSCDQLPGEYQSLLHVLTKRNNFKGDW